MTALLILAYAAALAALRVHHQIRKVDARFFPAEECSELAESVPLW